MLTHKLCGGEVKEDWTKTYDYDANENGTKSKVPAYRCVKCNEEILGDAQLDPLPYQ